MIKIWYKSGTAFEPSLTIYAYHFPPNVDLSMRPWSHKNTVKGVNVYPLMVYNNPDPLGIRANQVIMQL